MLRHWLFNKVQGVKKRLGLPVFNPAAAFGHSDPIGSSDLNRMFADHDGRLVHKWTQYLDLYDRHLASRRGTAVRMLEIGVALGGSLDLWRKYFGPQAVLYGVDINPDCASRVDEPNQVRIGSQDNSDFLHSVVCEMGGLDVALDDGSHIGRHQWASFKSLWPLLSVGGLYIIEDLHTAYWTSHEGGYRAPDSGISLVKRLLDDMHGWYHDQERLAPPQDIGAIHAYDSVVFIEKVNRPKPAETLRPYSAVETHFGR